MGTRRLYLARHGMADAFGVLTDTGRRQAVLLGERLARLPISTVWHSPLPRAADTAYEVARQLPDASVQEAAELVDQVPYVPTPEETPRSWVGFFDGYDKAEAEHGNRLAQALVARFAGPPDPTGRAEDKTYELLVTHAYPIAWLLRHALGAPDARWLSLSGSANTGLTVIEYHDGLPPAVMMFNDLSHLPSDLRWTGFGPGVRA